MTKKKMSAKPLKRHANQPLNKKLSDYPAARMAQAARASMPERVKTFPMPGPHPGAGRPPAWQKQFRSDYCIDVIDHLKGGNSFECFGAYLGNKYGLEFAVGRTTLFEWLKAESDFADARQIGEAYGREFWEEMGKSGTLGMLRRVVTEEPMFENGQQILDENGEPVMKKTYAPATFSQNSWRMIVSSRFGFHEKRVNEHSGPDGGPIEVTPVSMEEKIARLRELDAKLAATEEGDT